MHDEISAPIKHRIHQRIDLIWHGVDEPVESKTRGQQVRENQQDGHEDDVFAQIGVLAGFSGKPWFVSAVVIGMCARNDEVG